MLRGYARMIEKVSESHIDEVLNKLSLEGVYNQLPVEEICMVDYLSKVLSTLQKESCGKCTLCRISLRQMTAILKDAMEGRGRTDDMSTIKLLCEGLRLGTDCTFGKKTADFIEEIIDKNYLELEEHITKKGCRTMVCQEYTTIHILGNLCKGCGNCIDVCEVDAIAGKSGYIHIIDNEDCTKCGKCLEVCPNEAIIRAGIDKPRCPERLIRVGRFRTRRKG